MLCFSYSPHPRIPSPPSSFAPNLSSPTLPSIIPSFQFITTTLTPASILLILLSLIPSLASTSSPHPHLNLHPSHPQQQPLIPSKPPALLTTPSIPSTAPLPLNTALIKPSEASHHHPSNPVRSPSLPPLHPYSPSPDLPTPSPQPTQPPTTFSSDQQLLLLQRRQLNWTTVITVIGAPNAGAQSSHNDSPNNAPSPSPQPTPTSSQTPVDPSVSSVSDQTLSGASLPADRPCYPGEESQRYPGHLSPTRPTQTTTLLVIGLYFFATLVCWNLFLVRYLLFPLKVVVVGWHELGHLLIAVFAGAEIKEMMLDPNLGGTIVLRNPISPAPFLPAGYLSSCLFGGLMIFCGFNTLASKIASFFVGMSFIGTAWWAHSIFHKIVHLGAIGVLIAFWFVDHAGLLRYYVLLMGVLSCWYVLFDVMDDFMFRKPNPCCPILWEERWPRITAGQWTLFWIFYSALNFTAWILLSLAIWRQTPRGMFCQSQQFLPT